MRYIHCVILKIFLDKFEKMNSKVQENEGNNIPADILCAANEAVSTLIPAKSKFAYEHAYRQFCNWRLQYGTKDINESIILAYFYEKVRYSFKIC